MRMLNPEAGLPPLAEVKAAFEEAVAVAGEPVARRRCRLVGRAGRPEVEPRGLEVECFPMRGKCDQI